MQDDYPLETETVENRRLRLLAKDRSGAYSSDTPLEPVGLENPPVVPCGFLYCNSHYTCSGANRWEDRPQTTFMNRLVHRCIYRAVPLAVGKRSVLDCCVSMGRPKQFNREGVLDRAIPVFWKHGFANTTVQHLEEATGVNKSGLYSEFKDKEDLFLASLERYAQTRGAEILTAQPLGWGNIERFLRLGFGCDDDQRGCFAVNSMRELASLPTEAQEIISSSQRKLTRLLIKNIQAEDPKLDASMIADVVLTFFQGFCIAQNLKSGKASSERKIRNLLQLVRTL